MTITIKEYSWKQTAKTLSVKIECPIFFVAKNVDVFHSDMYVKVSHPPYIFELFFEQSVRVSDTRCLIQGTTIDFEFFKVEENIWKDVKAFNFELNSSGRKERRTAALTWRQNYEAELARQALVAERERERMVISNSIDAEEKTRKSIEEKKEEIRREFESDLAKNVADFWREKDVNREKEQHEENVTNTKENEINHQTKNGGSKKKNKKTGHYNTELARKVAAERDSISGLRQPRSFATISFEMTPRRFPGPVRESKSEEEEEWIKKRAEILRKSCRDDNGEELRDVESVLRKGEEVFKLLDFQSAFNIYTYGIEKISSDCAALFSNRAACCLKLGSFEKAIDDASKALELLNPPVEANAAARTKAILRRGSAFAELGMYTEAIKEFEAAADLMPSKRDEIVKNVRKLQILRQEQEEEGGED